jgi:hypothetical protein
MLVWNSLILSLSKYCEKINTHILSSVVFLNFDFFSNFDISFFCEQKCDNQLTFKDIEVLSIKHIRNCPTLLTAKELEIFVLTFLA